MKKMLALILLLVLTAGCGKDEIVLGYENSAVVADMENILNPATIGRDEGRRLWEGYREFLRDKKMVVAAVGDIMLGRRVGRLLDENGGGSAFSNFSFLFERSDLLFGNLECSLSERGERLLGKGIWLRASPGKAELLKDAGFSVLSLANNHILDYGDDALLDTINILDQAGIAHVGAGMDIEEAQEPYVYRKGEVSLGTLAYHEFSYYFWSYEERRMFAAEENVPGTAPMDIDAMLEDVRKLKGEVDLVAVSLHWGIEESNHTVGEQRRIARELIDAGADIIIGHHPHVIQGVEIYRNRPIIYSLGNYIFDQNDENNKQGMVVEVEIYEGDLKSLSLHPLYVKDKREPVVPEGGKYRVIMDKITRLSESLGTELVEGEGVLSYFFDSEQ